MFLQSIWPLASCKITCKVLEWCALWQRAQAQTQCYPAMFSRVLTSASSYFHLPIDDLEDEVDFPSRHIACKPSDSPDSDNASLPSTSSSVHSSKSHNVIQQILDEHDLYRVLGLQRSYRIDKLTLRRAYLTRSRACHPDKFPHDPEATRAFQKVSVAYDVLSKPSTKRLYDSRSPHATYDIFSASPFPPPEETFRSVVIGVFNDILDGDLDMIRTLLRAVNEMNPALRLGEEGINSVFVTLRSVRDRAKTCRTCIFALHDEVARLLEVQRAFRDLSYFDLRRRTCLTVRLARITVSLPIALEHALQQQKLDAVYSAAGRNRDGVGDEERTAIMNQRLYVVLCGVVNLLERMERILNK